MRILVVGSGGREHALVWSLSRHGNERQILCLPGNAGIASLAQCLPGHAESTEQVLAAAAEVKPDLVVIGPEDPLAAGLVDSLEQAGFHAFGPSAKAARLEADKAFAKEFMTRHRVPTAGFEIFDDPAAAHRHLDRAVMPVVVKASGLAKGKGVSVCISRDQAHNAVTAAMEQRVFGDAGDQVLIEECLFGQEVTYKVFCDGEHFLPMPPAQDYKPVGDDDKGPNTGGMGCYSPVPLVDEALEQAIVTRIIRSTIQGLASEGTPYRGVLYAGLMITPQGPHLLEFNCRFGDPETQVLLPRLQTDLVELLQACREGRLREMRASWSIERAVCVVAASAGYPGPYKRGETIIGLERAERLALIFHAGTARADGRVVTNGGRVLGVTGRGTTFAAARERAYAALQDISFRGMHYRRDIAARVVEH